jgi:two-component system sensor histidine kinase TctE
MNEMLQRVEQSIAVQKSFIADAAHQMKTPLAGMRMQSELALRQDDPEEIRVLCSNWQKAQKLPPV